MHHLFLSRLSAPYLNTLPTRLGSTLGNQSESSTRIVSQSTRVDITSPESSRRLEDPSRLSARVGLLYPILIHGHLHPLLASAHTLTSRVNRSQFERGADFQQDTVDDIGNKCFIPTKGKF